MFTTYGKTAVSNHFYWRFPLAVMATFDKAEDLRSARALRALDPAMLVVGHGPAVRSPGASSSGMSREAMGSWRQCSSRSGSQ